MAALGNKGRSGTRAVPHIMAGLTTVRMEAGDFIPGPKLRAKFGISAVTLWRWRHDPATAFPAPKRINGRLYFPSDAVAAWLAKQPEAL